MADGANHVVQYLQGMYNTVKLYHWSTHSHAHHIASDQLTQELLKTIDHLVEVYIGRYERPRFPNGMTLHVPQDDDAAAVEQLKEYGRWLKTDFLHFVKPHDTDLLNIRDELLAALHQTLYRYTLI